MGDAESSVSQVENDRLCTNTIYNPWTLTRTPCDREAVRSIGYDTRDIRQFRFCVYCWDEFERTMRRDVFADPGWKWLVDHIVSHSITTILRRVIAKHSEIVQRRAAGQQALAAVVTSGFATSSVVYFVQQGPDGPIKIGTTRDLRARFADLQVGSPHILRIRAVQHGDRDTERQYHDIFQPHRLGGEWFEPVPKLLATIDAINAAAVA